jgi:hypothetical protein
MPDTLSDDDYRNLSLLMTELARQTKDQEVEDLARKLQAIVANLN